MKIAANSEAGTSVKLPNQDNSMDFTELWQRQSFAKGMTCLPQPGVTLDCMRAKVLTLEILQASETEFGRV